MHARPCLCGTSRMRPNARDENQSSRNGQLNLENLSCRRFDWMQQSSSRRDEPRLGKTLHFIGYFRGGSAIS